MSYRTELPANYDQWRTASPYDRDEDGCDWCDYTGACPECNGDEEGCDNCNHTGLCRVCRDVSYDTEEEVCNGCDGEQFHGDCNGKGCIECAMTGKCPDCGLTGSDIHHYEMHSDETSETMTNHEDDIEYWYNHWTKHFNNNQGDDLT